MGITEILIPVVAAIGLIIAFCLAAWVRKAEVGTDKMKEVADMIRKGASRFLTKEFRIFAITFVVVALVLGICLNWITAVLYIIGAALSALAAFLGVRVTTWGNVRTANAAMSTGMSKAFKVAFRSGAVIGLCVTGLALLGLGLALIILGEATFQESIIGFGFGASSMAFFGRIAGGIYTKTSDIGAGLVCEMDKKLADDDLRNPAVIADNVGDNVGNVAGVGFSSFESYVCSMIAAIMLSTIATYNFGEGEISERSFILFPIVIACVGVLASIIGIIIARCKNDGRPLEVIRVSGYVTAGIVTVASIFLSKYMLQSFDYAIVIIIGIVVALVIAKITEYFTSSKYKEVRNLAEDAVDGAASSIISGLSLGMKSTLWPIILLAVGVFASFFVAGFYGIALAAVGMLSFSGVMVAVASFGPVADNADGISEMEGLSDEANKVTNELDFVGNLTSAISKGFSIGSAALTTVALLVTFAEVTNLTMDSGINLLKPIVMVGLIIGAMLPFVFTSQTTKSITKALDVLLKEIKWQFSEKPDILSGDETPDYDKCLDAHMDISLKETIVPGVIGLIVPVAVGMLFGSEILGGLLCGALVSGIVLAFVTVNSGGAWDNAKKYIEDGNLGGRESKAFEAASTSDMVGDSFKDTAGPSISVMIKLMMMASIAFAPLIAEYGGLIAKAIGY